MDYWGPEGMLPPIQIMGGGGGGGGGLATPAPPSSYAYAISGGGE